MQRKSELHATLYATQDVGILYIIQKHIPLYCIYLILHGGIVWQDVQNLRVKLNILPCRTVLQMSVSLCAEIFNHSFLLGFGKMPFLWDYPRKQGQGKVMGCQRLQVLVVWVHVSTFQRAMPFSQLAFMSMSEREEEKKVYVCKNGICFQLEELPAHPSLVSMMASLQIHMHIRNGA